MASRATTADVAIIGGGVMGASAACHLAARGMRDIVVFDRGALPGSGSTSRATGGFRAQFATAVNVGLSILSRSKLRNFAEDIGGDPGYLEAGYLLIASSERELALLRTALAVQQAAGLTEAEEISVDDVQRLNPAVALDGIAGGTFCESDGFIGPMGILHGYIGAAERLGVRFEWGVEVTEIRREDGGRAWELTTSTGPKSVAAIVNAAGAWASLLAGRDSPNVPVSPLKRQVAVTVPCTLLPPAMPMTIFLDDGFHLRVRDGRVLLLWPHSSPSADQFETVLEDDWLRQIRKKADARVPLLREVEIDRAASYAGLYEMSPDSHAILGAWPGCDNYYVIAGSSGHGVMHSPALGQLLSEIICDGRATSLDVEALRPSRFSEGKLNAAMELL